jgi:predicted MFS family arabinose efflux permease
MENLSQTSYYTLRFASTYGSQPYDTSTYNGSNTTTSNDSTGSGNGGVLVDTGIAVASVVTLAAVILLVAMVVRVWKRRPGKNPEED